MDKRPTILHAFIRGAWFPHAEGEQGTSFAYGGREGMCEFDEWGFWLDEEEVGVSEWGGDEAVSGGYASICYEYVILC